MLLADVMGLGQALRDLDRLPLDGFLNELPALLGCCRLGSVKAVSHSWIHAEGTLVVLALVLRNVKLHGRRLTIHLAIELMKSSPQITLHGRELIVEVFELSFEKKLSVGLALAYFLVDRLDDLVLRVLSALELFHLVVIVLQSLTKVGDVLDELRTMDW